MHTLDADTGETAPIAIIGTRKDKISSPADHQRISTILYDHFSSSLAWANVIENDTAEGANGRASLFFYPVDNLKGRADPSVVACLRDIERVLEKAEYVHREQPLVYLQWLDKVTALKKMYLSYEEAVGVAVACGVALDDASQMLNLFHEMGIVMFHDEPELRDVVILDPINFFVVPVTTVICKHAPTETDPTHHLLEVHKLCRKKKHLQWQKFTKNGIVSDDLLRMLLMGHEDNYDRLVRLMIKFGLLVRLQSSADDTSATVKSEDVEYLVPALMPANPSPEASWSDQEYSTCYLIFSTSKEFEQSITISESDLETYGFLPQGLYERLIGRAVAWVSEACLKVNNVH